MNRFLLWLSQVLPAGAPVPVQTVPDRAVRRLRTVVEWNRRTGGTMPIRLDWQEADAILSELDKVKP